MNDIIEMIKKQHSMIDDMTIEEQTEALAQLTKFQDDLIKSLIDKDKGND